MKKRMKRITSAVLAGIFITSTLSLNFPLNTFASESEFAEQNNMEQVETEPLTAETPGIELPPSEADSITEQNTVVETEVSIDSIYSETTAKALEGWTLVENDSGSITYEGTWNQYSEQGHSQGSAHQSDAVGATASYQFTGTGIQWIGQTDTNFTKAKVYLDGELMAMPDSNNSPMYQRTIYTLIGIPYGEHTFVIESQGPPNSSHNINFIELDALAYTTDQTPVTADSLIINNSTGKMKTGETLQLDVSLKKGDSQVYASGLSFASSVPSVAEINKKGLIKAISNGKTQITASINGLDQSFWLEVRSTQVGALRRVIDSEHPLFYHHLYRQSNPENLGQGPDSLQGGLDIQTFWDSLDTAMTPETKQYQAILIHAGGNINDDEDTRRWYKMEMDKTTADQIPFFLMISNSYTDHPFDNDWLAEMYEQYPNMLGVVYSENHASVWQNHGGYRSEEIASKLELSAEYGGYVIFADTNNYDEYMESTLKNTVLMEAAKKYRDNFIIMPKYTSQWSMAGYNSYQSVAMGTWLSGYAGNWGSLIDSWQWWDLYYYNDPFRKNRVERLGGGEECRHPFSFPELNYPIRMLSEANSGATVFSFEHPFYSTAIARSENEPAYTTPAFDNAIVQAMDYIIANHSQTREEVMSRTKVAFDSGKGTLNKTAEAGVNLIKALYGDGNLNHKGDRSDENEMLMMQLSGRYGIIPSIPALATDEDKKIFTDNGIQLLNKDSVIEKFKKNTLDEVKTGKDTATQKAVQEYFNQFYEENATGNAYVQNIDNYWFTYNNRWTGYPVSSLVQTADLKNTEFGNGIHVSFDPYTYINFLETSEKVTVNFNNYFVDKSDIWENYTQRWDGDYNLLFQDYLMENYIPKDKTRDNEFKKASITFKDLQSKPEIQNLTGLKNQYDAPKETWNEETGEYTLEINANGYMNFEIVKTTPEEPLNTDLLLQAIDNAQEIVRDNYTAASLNSLDSAAANAYKIIVSLPGDITQETVDLAVASIQNAMKSLVKKPADLTVLITGINLAKKIDRTKYQAGSLSILDKALAEAERIVKLNPDIDEQNTVNNTLQALASAVNNLKENIAQPEKKADVSALTAVINKAAKLDRNKYTTETLAVVDKSIKAAQELLSISPKAELQTLVTITTESAETAIRGLKSVPQIPKKGTKVTIGNFVYKITSATSKSRTATVVKPKKNTFTKLTIPSSIKVNSFTFKVTGISDKAFQKNNKLTSITIGSNITSIGKQSFSGCSKLKKILVKSSSIKTVEKDALKNIHKTATIQVPAKKWSSYKSKFKNKGQAATVTFKKYKS